MSPRKSTYHPPTEVAEINVAERYGKVLGPGILKAPSVLYTAGNRDLLQGSYRRVCVIGSRAASDMGLKRAAKLARQLVELDIVVVSGLAKGIDHAAHSAAIEAGGKTIAVIGTPLAKVYPAEHAELQERIYRDHLLVSHFPEGSQVYPSNFIARNRTMALISDASVIVEAGDTSGSLSQAAETQRLKHPLFIMANVIKDSSLKWPKKFLDAGATVLEDIEQITKALLHAPHTEGDPEGSA